MTQNIHIRLFFITSCLFCILFGCNRQKSISKSYGLDTVFTIQKYKKIDSTKIYEDDSATVVSHSLSEIDTGYNTKYPIGIFKSKGEIFRIDSNTSQITKILFAEGKIDTFFLSPGGKFTAFIIVCATGKEPGLWKPEEAPEADIYSIVVVNNLDNSIIREINTSQWNIAFDKWISNSRFLYTTNDGFAVSDFYIYDAIRDILQRLPYGQKQ